MEVIVLLAELVAEELLDCRDVSDPTGLAVVVLVGLVEEVLVLVEVILFVPLAVLVEVRDELDVLEEVEELVDVRELVDVFVDIED